VLVAVAQPLVLNAVIAVSAAYLVERDRATGIAVSSAGVFAGIVLALLFGAAFGAGHVTALIATQAVVALVAAGLLVGTLRTPPGVHRPAAAMALRAIWADPYIRVLIGLICPGFGVFVALTTWLQTLLDPAGVSETEAGLMLLALVLAGVVGAALLPPWLARRRWQVGFVILSVAVSVVGLVVLAIAPGVATGFVVLTAVGVLLLTDLPIVLELAERRAGDAAATAGSLVWLAGNAAGLVVALLVQAVLHQPTVAFLVLAAVLVAGAPLLQALRQHTHGDTAQASPGE
jgi:cyanate permease